MRPKLHVVAGEAVDYEPHAPLDSDEVLFQRYAPYVART